MSSSSPRLNIAIASAKTKAVSDRGNSDRGNSVSRSSSVAVTRSASAVSSASSQKLPVHITMAVVKRNPTTPGTTSLKLDRTRPASVSASTDGIHFRKENKNIGTSRATSLKLDIDSSSNKHVGTASNTSSASSSAVNSTRTSIARPTSSSLLTNKTNNTVTSLSSTGQSVSHSLPTSSNNSLKSSVTSMNSPRSSPLGSKQNSPLRLSVSSLNSKTSPLSSGNSSPLLHSNNAVNSSRSSLSSSVKSSTSIGLLPFNSASVSPSDIKKSQLLKTTKVLSTQSLSESHLSSVTSTKSVSVKSHTNTVSITDLDERTSIHGTTEVKFKISPSSTPKASSSSNKPHGAMAIVHGEKVTSENGTTVLPVHKSSTVSSTASERSVNRIMHSASQPTSLSISINSPAVDCTDSKQPSSPVTHIAVTETLTRNSESVPDEIGLLDEVLSSAADVKMDCPPKPPPVPSAAELGGPSITPALNLAGMLSGAKAKLTTVTTDSEPRIDTDNNKDDVIDELQKYLREKFGPMLSEAVPDVEITDTGNTQTATMTFTEESTDNKSDGHVEIKTGENTDHIEMSAILPRPIFFKTSMKDPGSRLHDSLLSELGSVLHKRDKPKDGNVDGDKTDPAEDKNEKNVMTFPKHRVSAKGNKILGNKALMASLESQLSRTLNRHKVFQRQKLHVLGLETIELGKGDEIKSETTVSKDSEASGNDSEKANSADAGRNYEDLSPRSPTINAIFDSRNRISVNRTSSHIESTELNNIKIQPSDNVNFHESSKSNTVDERPKFKDIDNDNETTISPGNIHTVDLGYAGQTESTTEPKSSAEYGLESEGDSDDHQLYIYALAHPEGHTEGIVCSVETRRSTTDSSGRSRKFITCINIVGEQETSGCPFIQDVSDGGMPTASGGGLYFSEEDKPASFNVDVGKRKGDLRVSVSGPNSLAKCNVDPQADGSYTVTYIPVEVGIFDISVTWNGEDIAGSPYHPKVLDARKVRIISGWQHYMDSAERINLVVGERKSLPFDTSVAGPGTLRAEVTGPSFAIRVDMDNHTMGTSVVMFTPEEEGTHYISIFWSDLALVNSPFHGYAVQQTVDASKLILTGRGLKEAIVREEAEFTIDGSQAGKGTPEVVLSGVRAEVNVKVVSIGNGKFRCSYVPVVPGAYLLHITWNGRQLRGSPYKVNVIGAFYPNRVVVSGDGLRGGILESEMSIMIDTRKAGPGELTAYCMGPHQVAYCELEDNRDGTFRLRVKPQEAGRHVMQIKYGGEDVQGSPFVLKVTSQPDASKVRVTGPGVEHGILATYLSKFNVETRGAGAGQLTVRIRGPKGGFQVEMHRDSQRDRTIFCHFDPTECGTYEISVRWSGVDVPGSPFKVYILDTQQELEQALNSGMYAVSHHGSQNTPRMAYSQWHNAV